MGEWLLFNANEQFLSYIMERTSYIRWDDNDVPFAVNQHALLYFYSASSLKQQSSCRHNVSLRHIIPIPSQPVFALLLLSFVCLSEKQQKNANTVIIFFGMIQPGLEPPIYKHVNHYHHCYRCGCQYLWQWYIMLYNSINFCTYTVRKRVDIVLRVFQLVYYSEKMYILMFVHTLHSVYINWSLVVV
jgi:hypothetical protein